MSYPLYPEKYTLTAMLTAQQMLDFRRKHGSLRGIPAPEVVILCLYKGLMKNLPLKYRVRRITGFLGDLYLLKRTGGRVGLLGNFGIGAPVVANMAEEMIAWGTQRLVLLSLAGGLQPDLKPGTAVVVDRALRDEGTSYHYLAPGREVGASAELAARLSKALTDRKIEHRLGAVWSTDAPYRESREEASQYQQGGVQAVDMESAGLFAVGRARGVETVSLLVVGDSLAHPNWSAPPDMMALHQSLKKMLRALVESL